MIHQISDGLHRNERNAALPADLGNGACFHVLCGNTIVSKEREFLRCGVQTVASTHNAGLGAHGGRQVLGRRHGPLPPRLQRKARECDVAIMKQAVALRNVDVANAPAARLKATARAGVDDKIRRKLSNCNEPGERGSVCSNAISATARIDAIHEEIDGNGANRARKVPLRQIWIYRWLLGELEPLHEGHAFRLHGVQQGDPLKGCLRRIWVRKSVHGRWSADGRSRTADLGFMNPSL